MPAAVAAVVGAGVGLAGAAMQADATKSAADKSAATQREAIALQREMYDQTRADLGPYREQGQNALLRTADLSGANGQDAARAGFADFYQSPGYQWQFNEGLRAVNAGAAAQGMLRSGATMKALQDRGNALAQQDFGTHYNRLLGLAGLGQNAAAQTGNAGTAAAGQIGGQLAGIAGTQASLGTAQSSIYGNAARGLGEVAQNYFANQRYGDKVNALAGGGYGGGGFNVTGTTAVDPGLVDSLMAF